MTDLSSWLRENPGTVGDYLRSLGASSKVVAFVESQDEDLHGKLANEVRKGARTVKELRAYLEALPGRRELTEDEADWIDEVMPVFDDDLGVRRWLVVQVLRSRTGGPKRHPVLGVLYTHAMLQARGHRLPSVVEAIRVRDWAQAEHIDLPSYTWERAMRASDAWHEAQAAKGASEVYDGSELTVHEWSDGWRLVRVVSENDLTVEGNRMGHCVGAYWSHVREGLSIIWSLRDTRNQPHVTIEAQPDEATTPTGKLRYPLGSARVPRAASVTQISGKQNREPIEVYKARLREFFSTTNLRRASHEEVSLADIVFEQDREGGVADVLEEALSGREERDEYELRVEYKRSSTVRVVEVLVARGASESSARYGVRGLFGATSREVGRFNTRDQAHQRIAKALAAMASAKDIAELEKQEEKAREEQFRYDIDYLYDNLGPDPEGDQEAFREWHLEHGKFKGEDPEDVSESDWSRVEKEYVENRDEVESEVHSYMPLGLLAAVITAYYKLHPARR